MLPHCHLSPSTVNNKKEQSQTGLCRNPETKKHHSISERAAFLGNDSETKMRLMFKLSNEEDDDSNVEHDYVKINLFGLSTDFVLSTDEDQRNKAAAYPKNQSSGGDLCGKDDTKMGTSV
jgi:hypothetical protein